MSVGCLFSLGLLLFLIYIAVNDAIRRRIPNRVILLMAGMALASLSLTGRVGPWEIGLLPSSAGALLALLGLLPFYVMRWMGAGDVKLATVLGMWVGWQLLLPIWITSVVLAAMHGVWLQRQRWFLFSGAALPAPRQRLVPYGTWLCLATILVWMYRSHSGS